MDSLRVFRPDSRAVRRYFTHTRRAIISTVLAFFLYWSMIPLAAAQVIPLGAATTHKLINTPQHQSTTTINDVTVVVSGTWRGNLTAPSDSTAGAWAEVFELQQDASGNVSGTRKTIPQTDENAWYLWSVTGTLSGNTLTLVDGTLQGKGSSAGGSPCQITATLNVSADAASFDGPWTAPASGCSGGTIHADRYGGPATKNLGSGLICDGGLGTSKSGNGSGGGAKGNADGSSCAEQFGTGIVGEPIDVSTGNYFLQEEDYSAGPYLTFRRFYNSSGAVAPANMGFRWRHSFDRSLQFVGNPVTSIVLLRPDGKQEPFTAANGTWVAALPVDVLTETRDAQGALTGYSVFIGGTRQTETYNKQGKLLSVRGQDGQGIDLTYTDAATSSFTGLVYTVTDLHGRQLKFTYDRYGNVDQIRLPDGKFLSYVWDTKHNVLSSVRYDGSRIRAYGTGEPPYADSSMQQSITGILDERGNRYESISYDNLGRAIASTFAGNVGTTRVAYNTDGTSSVTYPLGTTVTIGFSEQGGVKRVASLDKPCGSDCGQPWKARTYDANGFPGTMTDFNGVQSQTSYDAYGLIHQWVEAVGTSDERRTVVTWDSALRQPLTSKVQDKNGALARSTGWAYNSRGQMLARCEIDPQAQAAAGYICQPQGTVPTGVRRWSYTYCDIVDTTACPLIGLLLTETGPRKDIAQTTTYAYYMADGASWSRGDLKSVTNAAAQTTLFASYDKNGWLLRSIDPNGVVTDFTYYSRGWLLTRTIRANADGSNSSADATTNFYKDGTGMPTAVQDADQVYVAFAYDAAHRMTDAGDAVTAVHYTLDVAGNRLKEDTSDGSLILKRSLGRTFDARGQLTSVVDGLNHTVFNATFADSYDPMGQLFHSSNGRSVERRFGYDALSRLISTVDDAGGTAAGTKDAQTVTQYDVADVIVASSDPEGLVTNYERNGFGDPTAVSTPDAGTSTMTVDENGQTILRTDARGIQASYAYDALGRPIAATFPNASDNIAWHYDEAGATTGCVGSFPVGRLTRRVEAAVTTTYCYDAHGNITRKTQVQGTSTDTVAYGYTKGDRVASITTPDGSILTYSRNAQGRVNSVVVSVGGRTTTIVDSVTYLPMGPVTSYRLGNGQTVTRTYDLNYRPNDVQGASINLHFSRDAMGNIVSMKDAANGSDLERYVYDSLDRLVSVTDPAGASIEAYSYNRTGDRLSKTGTGQAVGAYGYEAGSHRLTSIGSASRTYDAEGGVSGIAQAGETFGFGYSGRADLTVAQRNSDTVGRYTYNANGERVAKEAMGTQRFVYNEARDLLGEYGTSNRTYVWMDDVPLAIVDGSGTSAAIHYIGADHLGTPRAVTNASGSPEWAWAFSGNPFGEVLPSSPTGLTMNLRFPGQYYDVETGQSYNLHRYYDAATGRYQQSDPLGPTAGPSTYAYVNGNPMGYTDPFGLCRDCDPAGTAPTPQEYERKGKLVSSVSEAHNPYGYGNAGGAVLNASILIDFRRGARLDAQVLYNGSTEYANYVFGVYLSAAGWTLKQALEGADDYGKHRSSYDGRYKMDLKYSNIPAVNVRNITHGYNDQQNGTLCRVPGR